MTKFTSAAHAYCWAFEILDVWRAGRGFDPDPDYVRGSSEGVMGIVLDAITVETIAIRCCDRKTCRYFNRNCFLEHFMPDPTKEPPVKGKEEEQRIIDCAAEFEERLRRRGWIE